VKVAFVVPRYGLEVNGGAERHCRDVAERMAKHWDVQVVTTCARDYMTWRDEYEPGVHRVNGLPVRRFPVDAPRDVATFNRLSDQVFSSRPDRDAEVAWMRAQGPVSAPLFAYLEELARREHWFVYFTYLYASTYYGVRVTGHRSVLVPTAHDEPPIYLGIFQDVFRAVRGLIFNTPEEQAFVNARFGVADIPQDVVAVGVDLPEDTNVERFRKAYASQLGGQRFVLYAGRIDPSKGCDHLFDYFERYRRDHPEAPLKLLLIGSPAMDVPASPDIVPLGFVSDDDKFDAMAAAEVLIVPSPYESLSLVALEAWRVGRPILANGKCEVLRAQCLRSNGGLWYESYAEFREALTLLLTRPRLAAALGRSGHAYVARQYRWEVVEAKYLALLEGLTSADARRV
jgi:glycosyltransferase involved in cell wall biosynthesis